MNKLKLSKLFSAVEIFYKRAKILETTAPSTTSNSDSLDPAAVAARRSVAPPRVAIPIGIVVNRMLKRLAVYLSSENPELSEALNSAQQNLEQDHIDEDKTSTVTRSSAQAVLDLLNKSRQSFKTPDEISLSTYLINQFTYALKPKQQQWVYDEQVFKAQQRLQSPPYNKDIKADGFLGDQTRGFLRDYRNSKGIATDAAAIQALAVESYEKVSVEPVAPLKPGESTWGTGRGTSEKK